MLAFTVVPFSDHCRPGREGGCCQATCFQACSCAARRAAVKGRMTPRGWVVVAGIFCLMSASQSLFVTFSGWLRDRFDISDTGISVIVFCMGFGELFASISAARVSDRWGKERSAGLGAGRATAWWMALARSGCWMPTDVGLFLGGYFELLFDCSLSGERRKSDERKAH